MQRDFDKVGRLSAVHYLSESPKVTPDVTCSYDAAAAFARDESDDVALAAAFAPYEA